MLGATLHDKCFLAKNSKLNTLYKFAHPLKRAIEDNTNIPCGRSLWNADVPIYCYGLDADRFGIAQ